MILLQAPVPAIQTTTRLPNPEFNDSESRRLAITVQRAMDGTKFTTVKSNGRSKLQYQFILARMKALELRAFILSYYRAKIRIINHKGEVWEGYFMSNPFEYLTGISEFQDITLEFEGERISAPSVPVCQ